MHTDLAKLQSSTAKNEPIVTEGFDNYLFLTGGQHHPLAFLKGETEPDTSSVENFWANLERRQALCRQIGTAYVHLVSPDKAFILRENFPISIGIPILERYQQAISKAIFDNISPHLCYPLKSLREEIQQVCSRVDSHFTPMGSLCCLEAALELAIRQEPFARKSGSSRHKDGIITRHYIPENAQYKQEVTGEIPAGSISPGINSNEINISKKTPRPLINLSILRPWVIDNSIEQGAWSGDLGSKLDPQREETKVSLKLPQHIKLFNNQIIKANDGICDIYINRNRIANSPRALVFGDSFGRGLVPMMTRIFGMVLFCRSRYIHDEIVLGFKPHLVISQNAERYLSRVSHDDERPPFLLYPSLRAEPVAVPNQFSKLMAACMAVGRPPFQRLIEQIQQGIPINNLSF
jgi:hypothetical protein